MSVINQVLNQLEQRGANTPLERTLVRAVPQSRLKLTMPLLVVLGVALGVALAAGIVTWQGKKTHKPEVVAMGSVQPQPAVPAPAAPPAAAPAVVVSAGETPLEEILPPVSRLIFESSSPPLPSTHKQDPGQASSTSSGGSGQAQPVVKNEVVAEEQSAKAVAPPAEEHPAKAVVPPAEEQPVKAAAPARSVKPRPTQSAPPKAPVVTRPPEGASPMKRVSPAQQAEAEFRNAVELMQQGHVTDAMAGYEAALRLDAGHDGARQALVALLLESRRGADAGRVLQDGLKHKPEHTGFAMLLARLQVEQGTVDLAAATLETSLPYAKSQADYQAFYAALMQRQNRHKEAIAHYQVALQLAPDNGIWLMGFGISLQALQRDVDARNAFQRALETKALSPELQAFVQQKLKGL